MKTRLGALERIFPMPCVLVVGGTMDQADTLAVAWINVVSSTPPTIAMGLRSTRRTLELIHENAGEFTVNIADTKLAAQVDFCGIASGRKFDKFADTGLTLARATHVGAPIIEQCPYNIECRTTHEVEVGDYVVVFGEILETYAEENILREGTDIVEMDFLDPLVYIPGAREYRGVGRKLHDAYTIGKAYLPSGENE